MAGINVVDLLNEDGSLKNLKQLPETIQRALVGLKHDRDGGVELKLEKIRVLEKLAKHHGLVGLDSKAQVNVTINMSGPRWTGWRP